MHSQDELVLASSNKPGDEILIYPRFMEARAAVEPGPSPGFTVIHPVEAVHFPH